MGRFSGLLSSAIFIGIIAFLIYLCCRTKRKGAVVQRSAGGVDVQVNGPIAPTAGVMNGYHPSSGTVLGYPQSYPPPQEGYYPYGAEPQLNNVMVNANYNAYPHTGNGGPGAYPGYSMNPPLNPVGYPINTSGGMPMPMPQHQPLHVQNLQASPPYPTASAPSGIGEDLPPPYHMVVGQQPK